MTKLAYTFKTDTLFKMLFVKHQDLLKSIGGTHHGTSHQRLRRWLWYGMDLEAAKSGLRVNAYQGITATDEFKERERLRHYARLNEASAIGDAEEREREKWQGVVADKNMEIAGQAVEIAGQAAEIEKLRLQIAELQAKAGG